MVLFTQDPRNERDLNVENLMNVINIHTILLHHTFYTSEGSTEILGVAWPHLVTGFREHLGQMCSPYFVDDTLCHISQILSSWVVVSINSLRMSSIVRFFK